MSSWRNKAETPDESGSYETASAISTSTMGTGELTPTHTAMEESIIAASPSTRASTETVPWPGGIFIIREPSLDKVIVVTEGQLRLKPRRGLLGGQHWRCIAENGWLGFRNVVSGTYMGYDTLGSYHAAVKHHQAHEWFCARRHPMGGYILLTKHEDEMHQMAIGADGEILVETKGEGVAWEFLKVETSFVN